MGLRCLIGHDFGDRQTEREREERGDEAVVTVREYRECARCGERRIVSENKEVTSIIDPTPDLEDAEAASAEEPPTVAAAADAGGASDDEYDELSAEEDDGIILDDEPATERDRGEWPEREDPVELEGEPRAWPAAPGDDEGYDAEPDDGQPADDVEFGGSLTPERRADAPDAANTPDEEADDGEILDETGPGGDADAPSSAVAGADDAGANDDADDADMADADGAASHSAADAGTGTSAPDDAPGPGDAGTGAFTRGGEDAGASEPADTEPASGITSGAPGPTPTGQQRPDGDTEFVCPECGHTADSVGSSLRPGDICPECRRGYLSERERQT